MDAQAHARICMCNYELGLILALLEVVVFISKLSAGVRSLVMNDVYFNAATTSLRLLKRTQALIIS